MQNWFRPTEFTSQKHPRDRERAHVRRRLRVTEDALKKSKMELDNQNRYIIIVTNRVGCMSLDRHFPSGSYRTIWIRAVLASIALLAVLAARNVPPHFPSASRVHSAASADSHHDQRPRFDNSGSKWSAPADSFRPVPPTPESAHLTPTPRLFSTLQTKGFHFNRPPPIS
jgi:hypothetical protein